MHVVKIDVSPNVRTDIVSLNMSLRTSITPQALRNRVSGVLQMPQDRLRIYNTMGELVPEHLAVPSHVRVQDAWERVSATYDVLDVKIDNADQLNFILKVDQLWDHQTLVAYIAKILGKTSAQIHLTDAQGAVWHYPEDRLSVTPLVQQIDLLSGMGDQRGGARTVSTTQAYQGQQSGEQENTNYTLPEPYVPEMALDQEQEEHQQNGNGGEGEQPRPAPPQLEQVRRSQHAYQPRALVDGGVLYDPEARRLTRETLERHQRQAARGSRSRSRSRGSQRRSPNSIASTSAHSQVMLTSTAWPSTPLLRNQTLLSDLYKMMLEWWAHCKPTLQP